MTVRNKIWLVLLANLLLATACAESEFAASDKKGKVSADAKGEPNSDTAITVENAGRVTQISADFETLNRVKVDMTLDVKNKLLQQDITMSKALNNTEKTFTQNDRTLVTKMFKQGSAGAPVTENFQQAAVTGIVDILVVIDNSGSMTEEQQNLATRLDPLISFISTADWQIGVITTSIGEPCMRGLIKRGDANASTAFAAAVAAGINGSGDERGFYRAVEGLGCKTINPAGWLRANSSVAVLIVSDEDNCSTGGTCSPNNGDSAYTYVTNYLANTLQRQVGVNARAYGIYKKPGDATCTTAASFANRYRELVNATLGVEGSICDASYSTTLQSISKNIASTLKSQFSLKSAPDANSLVVKVNGVQVTTGYSVSGTTLTFTDVPPANAAIQVFYTTGAQPQLKEFALGAAPIPGTLTVLVNQMQVTTGFSVSAANSLVFDAAPAPSVEIKATFRIADKPLLKSFDIGKLAVANTIKVFVNNVADINFAYDITTGLVNMVNAPIDAAMIKIQYVSDSGPILEYPFMIVGQNPRDFLAVEKGTTNPVTVQYVAANGKIKVDPASFKDNVVVTVSYRNSESNKNTYMLANEPVAGSLKIDSKILDCELGKGIEVQGQNIMVDCLIGSTPFVNVSYEYELPQVRRFELKSVLDAEVGTWTVLVDGVATDKYKREGNVISFDEELARGAIVSIVFERKD